MRQGQSSGQPQRWRPTIDQYLESLTERQRDEIEGTPWFQGLDARHQADVRRRLAVLEEVEAEADALLQQEREDDWLAEYVGDEADDWPESDAFEEQRADQLEAESEEVWSAWSDETLTEAEALGLYDDEEGDE